MREKVNINDFIYRSDKPATKTSEQEDHNKYYTCFGDQEWVDDDGYSRVSENSDKIYAQSKSSEYGGTNYFVKGNRYGKLFNPSGMYSEGQHKRFNKLTGSDEFQFKKVSLRVFELYTSFLKTKNVAWLNNAEREMN